MDNNPSTPRPITITLPDGKMASAIANLVIRKKPIGWSKKSYGSYYKEVYAKWVRDILDLMMAERKPKRIPWDTIKGCGSKNSLYLRFAQGKMYLLHELDFDGKYRKFCEGLKVTRHDKVGIIIDFDLDQGNLPGAVDVVSIRDTPKWKKDLDNYLESGEDGKPFHKCNLQLTDDEVRQQITELEGLTNVMYSVTHDEIKVIKGVS